MGSSYFSVGIEEQAFIQSALGNRYLAITIILALFYDSEVSNSVMPIEIGYKDVAGRIGGLSTKTGRVETPVLSPVVRSVQSDPADGS
jgi:hypothetical protein